MRQGAELTVPTVNEEVELVLGQGNTQAGS